EAECNAFITDEKCKVKFPTKKADCNAFITADECKIKFPPPECKYDSTTCASFVSEAECNRKFPLDATKCANICTECKTDCNAASCAAFAANSTNCSPFITQSSCNTFITDAACTTKFPLSAAKCSSICSECKGEFNRENCQKVAWGACTVDDIVYKGTELAVGGILYPCQGLRTADGNTRLIMQTDGNLVLYSVSGTTYTPLWASDTANNFSNVAQMDADGSLSVKDWRNTYWTSKNDVGGKGNVKLVISSNRIRLVDSENVSSWSRTTGRTTTTPTTTTTPSPAAQAKSKCFQLPVTKRRPDHPIPVAELVNWKYMGCYTQEGDFGGSRTYRGNDWGAKQIRWGRSDKKYVAVARDDNGGASAHGFEWDEEPNLRSLSNDPKCQQLCSDGTAFCGTSKSDGSRLWAVYKQVPLNEPSCERSAFPSSKITL
ncbi:MAG: hypothetical protein ACK518_02855, partial [bacterium]